ncbi:stonustoxin subunit beta isoform X1 [Halichoeres trimaculatus]|uniref:stonustoxin subunit beta isoform X1 n=1 Tax=Halichoeres trimaculatus TaxID=147232 RepID=UPI003D9F2297
MRRDGGGGSNQITELAMDNLTIAALSRPFTIGMLYNARTEELLPGFSLWDDATLQKNTAETPKPGSEFHVSTSDSIKSKSSLLDIEGSLNLNLMCGLIKVGASAKFMDSTKKSKKKSRVTFRYHATTHFKHLSIPDMNLSAEQKDIISKGTATHVVTGILYGVNCFFVFDYDKMEESGSKDIGATMEAAVNKIPSCGIGAELKNKLTAEEKDLTGKFSCKFIGDLILDKDPVTYEDAVETYAELPKLLGESGKNSVPLKVWLMPLKNLDDTAAEVLTLSLPLVREVQDTLEDLREIGMRCNDALDDPVVEKFQHIKKKLTRFKKECTYYESDIKKAIAKKLPLVREGTEEEGAIKEIFEGRAESPFSSEQLNKWMDDAEREINVIRSILEILKGAKILPNKSDLDRVVLDPKTKPGLCYAFTSLDSSDPYLDAMTSSPDSVDAGTTKEDPWYYSDDVVQEMRRKARMLNAESGHVLISVTPDEDIRGARLYKYFKGMLRDCDLKVEVEKVTKKKDLVIYGCELNLDPGTVNKSLMLSEDNRGVSSSSQKYEDDKERFDSLPQVLCKEKLNRRCYWEVEFEADDENVSVGVCYEGMSRKGSGNAAKLGANAMSWCLEIKRLKTEATFTAKHNNQSVSIPEKGSTRVAVFLDWPGGTLSFYNVKAAALSHLHTFHATFSEPVYPALSILNKKGFFKRLFGLPSVEIG